MTNLLGQQIDTYRIEAQLGAGGMGVVYRAQDMALGRRVALKVMHAQFASQPQFQRRFMQEAQAAAKLTHPSIVVIHRFDNKQGYLYIVMEYVNGLSLGAYIKQLAQRHQVMLLTETAHIIAQVSDALGYAHRQGVVHRDIKPDNILIRPLDQPEREGEPPVRAMVTDFGLAKLLEGGIETQSGTFMGTLPYMSPEQALAKAIDGRSDIYSLGVVLYQLATGQLPFDIKSPTEAVLKHLHEVPPPPRQIQPGLPAALESVINTALAKEPADRYQTAEALASALRRAAAGLTNDDVTVFKTVGQTAVISLLTQLESADDRVAPSNLGFDSAAPGSADRLLIAQQGESDRLQTLGKKSLTLGRTDENDIVLPAHGVSRRHARLEKTAVGWQVTDLGSTNGSFLDSSKLLPDVPEVWNSGDTLRIGPFHLQWQPGQPQSGFPLGDQTYQQGRTGTSPGASQIHSGSGQLSLVVQPTHVDATPGQRSSVQVELFNQGMTVDHFSLRLEGLPDDWVTLPIESLQLMPGARGTLPVSIHPPQDSSARSGQHRYRLVASSRSDSRETAAVSGSVTVKPFSKFSLDMRPKRLKSPGLCRLLVRNEGNFDAAFSVFGRDPGEAVRFEIAQPRFSVSAGQTTTVDVPIQAKQRPFLGRKETLPFEVQVSAANNPAQTVAGQLEVSPILPAWVPGLLMALLLLLCVVSAGAYAYVNQQNQAATATAEAIAAAQVAATQTFEAQLSASELATRQAEDALIATATANAQATVEVAVTQTYVAQLSESELATQQAIDALAGTATSIAETAVALTAAASIPTATPTETPTPTATPTPAVGPWNGVWDSACSFLECSSVTLNQAEGSQTVSGTFDVLGGTGTLVGIVEENRLTGTWSLSGGNGTFDFWLAEDEFSWQGNWDKTADWCAVRGGSGSPLPTPCGIARWYGEWSTTYETLTITQNGVEVEGVYANGQGTITGTVDGAKINGTWFRSGNSGSLAFFLPGNGDQFNGNWNNSNAWCGRRSGVAEPNPCLNQGLVILPVPPIVIVTLQPLLPLPPIIFPTATP